MTGSPEGLPTPYTASIAEHLRELDAEHLSAVKRAVSNVLSSKRAVDTFVQIADGIPFPNPHDRWLEFLYSNIAVLEGQPSQEARDLVETLKADMDIESIDVDEKAVYRFAERDPREFRSFSISLIEIVARICHHLAATVFEMTQGGKSKHRVLDTKHNRAFLPRTDYTPFGTMLFHRGYCDSALYPRGAADVVGYWAETALFGGVVLFDRRCPGYNGGDVFLHPAADGPAIFRVSTEQLQKLAAFLTSEDPESMDQCLPIRPLDFSAQYFPNEAEGDEIYRSKYDRESISRLKPVETCHPPVPYIPGTDPATDADHEESERRAQERLEMMIRDGYHPPTPPAPLSPHEVKGYVEKC